MRRLLSGALVMGASFGFVAQDASADDYWDPTTYQTVPPNEKAAVFATLDAQSATCGYGVAALFDSCAWTLHQSNTLRIFRSTPPSGFFLQIR